MHAADLHDSDSFFCEQIRVIVRTQEVSLATRIIAAFETKQSRRNAHRKQTSRRNLLLSGARR
jgi:hypothetical protein